MKRLISLFIILVVIFSFTGCDLLAKLIPVEPDGANDTLPSADITDPVIQETDPVIEETQEDIPEQTEETDLDSDTQYRINLFLSNFAEAKITQYPCCNYHKLRFVLEHCQINNVGALDYADGNVHFYKATVDSILNKYTGETIKENSEYGQHQDCKDSGATVTFSENLYYCPADAQNRIAYVAVADRMTENEDGTYNVHYHVYELDSDFTSYDYSAIYKYMPDEAIYDWNLTAVYEAEAVVRDYYRSDGQASYQLISLNIAE